MLFPPSFVALTFALTTFGMPTKRDAAQVQADLADMNSQTLALDNALHAFPNSGGTLGQALTIHGDVLALEDSTTTATADVSASGPFSEADAVITNAYIFGTLKPIILTTLGDLTAKASAFAAISAGAIVLDDLQNLQKATDAFGEAMVAKMPVDQQAEAELLLDEIESVFATAINAFV